MASAQKLLGCEIWLAQRTAWNPNVGFGDLHSQTLQLSSAQMVPGYPPDGHGHQEGSTLPRWQQWVFFPPPTLTDLFAIPASGEERLSSQAGEQHRV